MDDRAPLPPDPEDRWIERPQGRLFTRTWRPASAGGGAREAAPIILFHDSLGCVELWREFPARLCSATGRPVIAYDRLGFGRSDPRTGRPSLRFVAEEAEEQVPALFEQLGVRRFVALGHSVGGGMAAHCAARFAGDCEALITMAAQAFVEDRTRQGIREAQRQFQDAQQLDRLARYHGDKTRWVLDAWIDTWLSADFAAWTLAPVLPQVRCPALAIHGELDEYGSTRHPETIAALCAGRTQVEILPATGHVPHREQPELVVKLVADFLGA